MVQLQVMFPTIIILLIIPLITLFGLISFVPTYINSINQKTYLTNQYSKPRISKPSKPKLTTRSYFYTVERQQKASTPTSQPIKSPTLTHKPTPIKSGPTSTPSPKVNNSSIVTTTVTYYGFPDNDPPGTAIAYPHSRYSQTIHNEASGVGTFEDPITFATDPNSFKIGTKLYVPYIQKYIIMEDWCSGCVANWSQSKTYHIDIWMNSNSQHTDKLISCQHSLTKSQIEVELDPPSNRNVSNQPLFDLNTGECPKL